jgi:hypothetical protein
MKMNKTQCDVKSCKAVGEPHLFREVQIGNLIYDLCSECYEVFEKWRLETFIEGRLPLTEYAITWPIETTTPSPYITITDGNTYSPSTTTITSSFISLPEFKTNEVK